MDWLRRVLQTDPPAAEPPEDAVPAPVERSSPGVAAVLDGVSEDHSHAVLDLGPGAATSLRVYGRFAQRVRFADLLGAAMSPEGSTGALARIPVEPGRPYDLVFAWDVLDRMFPEDLPRLVQRLVEVSAPGARLHLVTEAPDEPTTRPRRFTLLDADRIRIEILGPPRRARRHLLPAEVERILAPFQVVHGFTLKGGLREYVAVRREPTVDRRCYEELV